MRCTIALLASVLFSGVVAAWQLSPKSLAERVDDATVIVVAKIGDVHARTPSPIAGIGEIWEVSLDVSRTLKGSMPASARVTFVDVAVQDRADFRPSQARLWLLKGTTSTALLSAPASYESVLVLSEEPGVAALLRSRAASKLKDDDGRGRVVRP